MHLMVGEKVDQILLPFFKEHHEVTPIDHLLAKSSSLIVKRD